MHMLDELCYEYCMDICYKELHKERRADYLRNRSKQSETTDSSFLLSFIAQYKPDILDGPPTVKKKFVTTTIC